MKDEKDTKTADFLINDTGTATKKAGRPRKFVDSAARQAAYRARLKNEGKRVVSRIVRDVRQEVPLTSQIIDLSAVCRW
ncbi:MAG: hypothetical protein AUJ57_00720 [Zetaproteobacteria bacterium CG1_02_53_45]|nr:MAG: hypothetical protein AUJ57_00720 [Zetaproteobacteria bacterium CG1_02_53_45]